MALLIVFGEARQMKRRLSCSDGDRNMVLASNAIDFLRLLAIGYNEIPHEDLTEPPAEDEGRMLRAFTFARPLLSQPNYAENSMGLSNA